MQRSIAHQREEGRGLAEWRRRLGLSQVAFAATLGRSRRTVQLYETGEQPIPRDIKLALAALDRGLKPISLAKVARGTR